MLGSTLQPGDVVSVDLGTPIGGEVGLRRPAVIVTAARILRGRPHVVQVVPVASTVRSSRVEVVVQADDGNSFDDDSAIQCQHLRSVSTSRLVEHHGNVGVAVVAEVRAVVSLLRDSE